MRNSIRFSPEVRERPERMVREHCCKYLFLWVAIKSISATIGCVSQTSHKWLRMHEIDAGTRWRFRSKKHSAKTQPKKEKIKS